MTASKSARVKGRIHSIETFGTHEGPGIRFVLFMQGCLARCAYCQNPDTWDLDIGKEFSPHEIFKKLERSFPYITSSGGGITVSGGEPLLQIDFLLKLFRLCKVKNVHTAIDTGAFYRLKDKEKLARLFKLTDLFIVDIKAASAELHRQITKRELGQVIEFLDMLEKNKKAYWVRYVLIPGINNARSHIKKLKEILFGLKYCERFEFLPYHMLGKHKWEGLRLKYALNGIPGATPKDIRKASNVLKSCHPERSEGS